jgi:hypothetical protein
VRTVREDTLAFYTLRTFTIRRRNVGDGGGATGTIGTTGRKKKVRLCFFTMTGRILP